MCKHGDTVDHEVTMPRVEVVDPVNGETVVWEERRAVVPLDRCIAPLVMALQAAGIDTLGSCCGHGKGTGSILLADGRELCIHPKVWGSIMDGERAEVVGDRWTNQTARRADQIEARSRPGAVPVGGICPASIVKAGAQ